MSGWWNLFSEPWVPRLGWVLIHFLWQGTALALLLAVALRILARASAHVRYLVIGGALLLCGAMPVATWTMLAPATVLPFAPAPMLPEATPVPVPNALEAKSVVTMAAEPLGDAGMGWQERLSRGAEAALPYVVGLWFGGVLLLTLRLTWGWTLVQRLCLSGSPIHDVLCRERFQRLLERMRIGVPVRLLESARVEVPTLIGWLRPTILVPTSVFVGLSPQQLEAILAHELAHVRRYDYLVNLFQTVIETVLFYHSAVWWISRKLREERENCCDDIALEVMRDRLVYVSALAQLEAGRRMPLVLTASGGSLLQRIRRIVGANDRKVSAWPLWVLIIGILSVVCLTRTNATETPDTTKPSAQTYLEVTYIKTANSSAMSWSRKIPKEDAELMLKNPKNEVTELNNLPLTNGINTFSGKMPWGADFTIILNWDDSPTSKPHDLVLKINWSHANGGDVSYGFKDKASLGRNDCFVVTGPWKTKETSNLLIRFVDHPSERSQKADPITSSPPITLVAQTTSASPAHNLPPGPTAEEMKAVEDSQTPLMKALQSRQYDQARTLLAQGADCNATDKMGLGPLGALLDHSGNDGRFPMDILQTILARTRDPNPPVPLEFCTPPMSTPMLEEALFCATYSNGNDRLGDDRQVVKLLLGHGARFASAPADAQALLQAAALDDLPAIQQLVAKGTSPSAADGDGWTPLLVSIALDYDDAANWLIDHGANVSAPTRRGAEDPLVFATAHGNDVLVEKLIAKGAKPVLRGGDLWRAVDRNDQRLFDDLINAGADPKGDSQIHGSAGGQYFRQIDSDPLFICIAKGQTAMAVTLINKGVDPEPKNVLGNRNFAYWAVVHDRPQILRALLDHGANPLLKDDTGETPLSLAQKSHPDLVPMLQSAAQKNAQKSGASTVMPIAALAAEASFDMALERDRTLGTDPSVKSSTLAADAQMLLAIQKGDVVALKKVLEHAVDPNTFDPDRFYSCPVYWAVYFNQPEILKLLLEHLATGDLGPARETPLQLAQKSHPDLVPIIQEGLKRNRAVLTARLTEKLHSIHIDLPAFSGAPLPKVTQFLLDATSKAGYLDRRVNIGNMDLPPSTTITSPARPNISIWDALQAIADASKLRFAVDGSWPGCITLYPPRDEAVIHPSVKNAEDPPPAQAPSVTHADLYVSVKVVGINDNEYQAHRDPIDAAIRAGDADALTKFETYRAIDQPGCYVNYGKRMVIATGPRTLPDGSLAGETFLAIDLTPTQAGAQINFKGRVVVDTMAGSTQLSPSVVRPNIDSRQALIALDVAPGTTTALKSPDGPGGDATPEVLSGPYLVQSPDGKTSAVVRLFFFLKASPQA